MPEELPSVEITLKTLAAALKSLETPGRDKCEVLRLRCIIAGAKVYKELLADYMDYHGLEVELIEWVEGEVCGACEKIPGDSAQIGDLGSVKSSVSGLSR